MMPEFHRNWGLKVRNWRRGRIEMRVYKYRPMRCRRRRGAVVGVAAVSLAVSVVAACGSSNSGQSAHSSSSSSQGSQGLATAKKIVDQYRTRPTHVLVTTPVGKTIPTGKTVAFIHCGVPACNIWRDAFQQAASV